MNTKPILITGADRSGSSIVAKIVHLCKCQGGDVNMMYENKSIKSYSNLLISANTQEPYMPSPIDFVIRNDFRKFVVSTLFLQKCNQEMFFYKGSDIAQLWWLWNKKFPEAKWIIVRRRTGDIINSCKQTAYMKRFKHKKNLEAINVTTEEAGWLWWVRQYEQRFIEIVKNVENHKIVWPERMADGDFDQMKEVITWCGLEWDNDIEHIIKPLLRKGN